MPQKKTTKPGKPAQKPKMVDHVVTQEDLDANPDLVKDGVKVGETIQIPEPTTEKPKAPETETEEPEPTVQIHNTNPKRDIHQVVDGRNWSIGAGRIVEVPESVAEKIMAVWPMAKIARAAEDIKPPAPWEEQYPDAVSRAKSEHAGKGFVVKDTVGPDRPEVKETGGTDRNGEQVGDQEGNKHVCPTCTIEFTSLTACRNHQKVEHGT